MSPPLPDASKKSPRVYRNLQTKDLENVTFNDMEATGDPLSIELHNEDELRRLVLVQLARLTCKSEWTGLLTSSSGGMTSFNLDADTGSAETVGNGDTVKIAGGTAIGTAVTSPDTVTITNTGVTSVTGGPNIVVSSSTGAVTITGNPTRQFNLEADSGATQTVPTDGTGTLSIDGGTGISTATGGANDQVVITNDGVTSLTAGSNITLSGSTGAVTISSSGGGGGASLPKMIAKNFASQKYLCVTGVPPIGRTVTSISSNNFSSSTQVLYIPYVTDGHDYTFSKVQLNASSVGAGNINFAIFTSDSDGMPDSQVSNSSLAIPMTTGTMTGSFSSNVSLSNSTLFYLALAFEDTCTLRAHPSSSGIPNNPMTSAGSFNTPFILGPTTSGSMPSSVTASSLFVGYGLTPLVFLEIV